MFVPVKWLKDYVNIDDVDIKTLEEKLIMSGSKTEGVHKVAAGASGIVTGKLLKVEKHPNADKLVICQVDVGTQVYQIVTGADNVKEGDVVPVTLIGATLPDGRTIEMTYFRGVESNGMLVSLEELGFSDKVVPKAMVDGIWILDPDTPLGKDIFEVTDLDDYVVEFEITPNRPDCLSIIGMARETAATFGRTLKMPQPRIQKEVDSIEQYAKITVEDTDLCPRYYARVVKDVTIKPSPVWMQLRLMKAGMRPLNNIVDITNYVLLEYGQPIHAFDLDKLKGSQIVVRRAKPGETLVTLDDVERKLDENMLMIADAERSLCIAGVMGGEEPEVHEGTTRLLLEVANFNKTSIRETSRKLGLRTEASSRFEKGVDPELPTIAMNRLCQLIEELGAGTIVGGSIDCYPSPLEERRVHVHTPRVNQMLGTKFSTEEILKILNLLDLDMTQNDENISVKVPSWRADIEREIDIIEEIARLYGYDKIPVTLPAGNQWGAKTNGQHLEDVSKEIIMSCGYSEITTYSFVSPGCFDKIAMPEYSFLRKTVNLLNPLGEEYSVMRTTLVPNMLEVLARNYKRSVPEAAFFEIGNLFFPKALPVTELPIEKPGVVLGQYGGKSDFFTLKGSVETLLERLGIQDVKYAAESNNPTYHPGRCATVIMGNHVLGTIGEIHPLVLEKYDIRERAYVADLDFNILIQAARLDRIYKPLPKFPAISRDIAVLVADSVTAAELLDCVEQNGGDILESAHIFDVYKGKQIPENMKSVALGMVFRASDRTLTDEEVGKNYNQVVKQLEAMGATLRA